MTEFGFSDFHLSGDIIKAIEMLDYKSPTAVQQKVIPALLNKRDIIVKSRTGSGKTASFAIPVCHMVEWAENKPQALVITPTRELAIQVKEDIFNIGRFKRLKVPAVYGKSSFYNQEKELRQKAHIVVGTPGRLIDHLDRATLETSNIKYLVIDEADEMLNMGFIEQIEDIIARLPGDRLTVLLSATMPGTIKELCGRYMNAPELIEIEEQSTIARRILQEQYRVEAKDKLGLLRDITIVENPESCIIFCNTKQMVDVLQHELEKLKYTCEKIHGGMEQRDRLKVMNEFKQGRFRYLVATDVAARGIDIDKISLVINYDVPLDSEDYVHRVGRTGRVDSTGKAITFATHNDEKYMAAIEQYTGKEIPAGERPSPETVNSLKERFTEKMISAPVLKQAKGARMNKEILKLHINAGKKTKMRPVDIVGTLCNIKGMSAEDIGIINIADVSTFVEILNSKGELVYRELQKTPIKGRLRKVSKAE